VSLRIRVVGIGTGDPGLLTFDAARAIASLDVVLVADPADATVDLAGARRAVCDALVPSGHSYRFVDVPPPPARRLVAAPDPGLDRDTEAERVEAYASALDGLAPHEQTVGVLVWGDPTLHDSTIRVVEALAARWAARGVEVAHDVVPGISAPQLLAARHRVPLNRPGTPLHVTTGARLVDEYAPALGDVAVVLDGGLACTELAGAWPDLELLWGAHLGTTHEVLVRGRLADVVGQVRRARTEARERVGWVVDTYLLRAPERAAPLQPGSDRAPWPEVDSLSDGVLTLRPVTAEDWPVLLAEHNNDESMRWGFTPERLTEDQARRQAAEAPREWRRGQAARFAMVDAASGAGAGLIMVVRMGPPGVGLVGYGVLPEFRGRGLTTRALGLLADWVWTQTSVDRLELGHKVGNVASGRAATKAGFVLEGRHAARLPNPDGTRSDELYYGLVRPTPAAPAR
jgi:precorrin-6A synthase (deacetylating)